MIEPPTNIRAIQAERIIELTWVEGRVDRLPYHLVRAECPCAACRNEWTGERILDPASIRSDLGLEGMEGVGSYAVRLSWNDGHSSGLYVWDALRRLGERGLP